MSSTRFILWNIIKRDLKLRYRHSLLGFIWSLLNPLLMMIVLTLVFSVLFRAPSRQYPLFLVLGLLPWRFFSVGTSSSLWSVVGNPGLVTKVKIRREILVAAAVGAAFIGTCLEFAALSPLMVFFGLKPTAYLLLFPVLLVMELLLIYGFSLLLASLNVYFRDVSQIWEIALQLGFFVTPIFYDPSQVPSRFQWLFSINPMASIIESFRGFALTKSMPDYLSMTITLIWIALSLAVGTAAFRHYEPRFAEEV
jgi:lipopolysaccharide transport system permease protein